MKRFGVVLAVLLVAALMAPAIALADPPLLEPGAAIPANTTFAVPAGWIAATRGLAQCAPTFLKWSFTIDGVTAAGAPVHIEVPWSESYRYWLPVKPTTSELAGFDLTPFNPKIGAHPYTRDWRYTVDGGLPAGSYHFAGGMMQTRRATDLIGGVYIGQHTPYFYLAETIPDLLVFDFVIE